jgi:hypothetical protein
MVGTSRTLTLPGGRHVTITVPPRAQNGHVIYLPGQGEPFGTGGLILTLAIQQTAEIDLPATVANAEPTARASTPNSQHLAIPIPPPPPPVQGTPALTSTSRGKTISRPSLSRGKVILLIGLIFLLIVSGLGLFYVTHANQPAFVTATVTHNTTATAQSTSLTPAFATINPSIIAANPNPYPPSGGTLALYDPLRDNNAGYRWDYDAVNCTFTGGAYHMHPGGGGSLIGCNAGLTNFSNFAFEVQMQIVKGSGGGIMFRVVTTLRENYLFLVSQDGSYGLYLFAANTAYSAKSLTSASSPAIKRGLNQVNFIAVVVQGSTITLYMNHQRIAVVNDSTYSQGQIGLAAGSLTSPVSPTEVVFSNAKVWAL